MTEITLQEMMMHVKFYIVCSSNSVHYQKVKRIMDSIPHVYDEASHTKGITEAYCYMADNGLLEEDDD